MSFSRIEIARGDITKLDVDAIVNAANEDLLPGGGVCGAIHHAAGPQLAAACQSVTPCPTGEARITPGFDLRARHVIHAVGPIWDGGGQDEPNLLTGAYVSSLRLAAEHRLESLAFPAISTGIYGYPLGEASQIAVRAVRTWLDEHHLPRRVLLVAFSAMTAEALHAALGDE